MDQGRRLRRRKELREAQSSSLRPLCRYRRPNLPSRAKQSDERLCGWWKAALSARNRTGWRRYKGAASKTHATIAKANRKQKMTNKLGGKGAAPGGSGGMGKPQ